MFGPAALKLRSFNLKAVAIDDGGVFKAVRDG